MATRYFDEHGICVYDELIEAERRAGVRMVDEVGGFVAFEPWAAQTPFETWIAPVFHQGSFGDLADEAIEDLAGILIRTLTAVRRACGDPDYNLVMYSAPTNGGHAEQVFHWHLKLIPGSRRRRGSRSARRWRSTRSRPRTPRTRSGGRSRTPSSPSRPSGARRRSGRRAARRRA